MYRLQYKFVSACRLGRHTPFKRHKNKRIELVIRLAAANWEFPDANWEFPDANWEFPDANCRFRPSNWEFPDANCRFRPSNCEFPDANCRFGPSDWEFPDGHVHDHNHKLHEQATTQRASCRL